MDKWTVESSGEVDRREVDRRNFLTTPVSKAADSRYFCHEEKEADNGVADNCSFLKTSKCHSLPSLEELRCKCAHLKLTDFPHCRQN